MMTPLIYSKQNTMKNSSTILLIAVAIILLQSCTRTMYIPNMQNAPLLKEKNEVRATLATNNCQIAYAVTDGLGVMLNGYSEKTNTAYDFSETADKRTFAEIGIGYFKPLNERAVFEIYTGVGKGKVAFGNREYSNGGSFSTNFKRYFIQPSIGFSFSVVDLSLSMRYSHLSFYDSNTSRYKYNGDVNSIHNLANVDKHKYGFIEPAVTMRVGWKYVKLQFQVQRAAQIYSPGITYNDTEFNLGIHFNIAKRFKEDDNRIRKI